MGMVAKGQFGWIFIGLFCFWGWRMDAQMEWDFSAGAGGKAVGQLVGGEAEGPENPWQNGMGAT